MGYQAWQASAAPEHPDLQLHLHVQQLAVTGSSLELELAGITSPTLVSALILGWSDPNADVTGMLTGQVGLSGCVLHASLDFLLPLVAAGGSAPASIAIPASPSLAGAAMFVQGLSVVPGESLMALVPSDAFGIVIGN
jgi:hypothetical protein